MSTKMDKLKLKYNSTKATLEDLTAKALAIKVETGEEKNKLMASLEVIKRKSNVVMNTGDEIQKFNH